MTQRFTDVPVVQRMLRDLRTIGDDSAASAADALCDELNQGGDSISLRRLVREFTTVSPNTGRSVVDDTDTLLRYQSPEHRLPAWAQYYDPSEDPAQWSQTEEHDSRGQDAGSDRFDRLKFEKERRGELIQRALDFFDAYGLQIGMAMLYASLPTAYGAQRGVQVLNVTGSLVTSPTSRVRSTAGFVIAVMTPDPDGNYNNARSLLPGNHAADWSRRIRLLHGVLRKMLTDDPDVKRQHDEAIDELSRSEERGDRRPSGLHKRKCASRPELIINQAELLGTLLTFTVTVFEALDKLGVPYEQEDKEAYYFLWSVVGAHLGIGELSAVAEDDHRGKDILTSRRYFGEECSLLPITPDEGERLLPIILDEEQGESVEGRVLTKALLRELSRPMPQSMKPAPATMMRYLLGDERADQLGVPRGGWVEFAYRRFGGKRFLDRRARNRRGDGALRRLVSAELSTRMSKIAIDGFMSLRDPRERTFRGMEQLSERWSLKEAAAAEKLVPFDELG